MATNRREKSSRDAGIAFPADTLRGAARISACCVRSARVATPSTPPGSAASVWSASIDMVRACWFVTTDRCCLRVRSKAWRATGGRGTFPPAHLGGDPESRRHRNREEWLKRYYDEVIEHLEHLDHFVIAGPGPAKHELRRRLERIHGMPERLMTLLTLPERVGDPALVAHLDRLITEV
jgi:hypothetical protein